MFLIFIYLFSWKWSLNLSVVHNVVQLYSKEIGYVAKKNNYKELYCIKIIINVNTHILNYFYIRFYLLFFHTFCVVIFSRCFFCNFVAIIILIIMSYGPTFGAGLTMDTKRSLPLLTPFTPFTQ